MNVLQYLQVVFKQQKWFGYIDKNNIITYDEKDVDIRPYIIERIIELKEMYDGSCVYRGKFGNHIPISFKRYLESKVNITSKNGKVDVISSKGKEFKLITCKLFNRQRTINDYDLPSII